jgi:hypothetical protein
MRRTDKSRRLERILKVFHRFFQDMNRARAYTHDGGIAMSRFPTLTAIYLVAALSLACDRRPTAGAAFSPSSSAGQAGETLNVDVGSTLNATVWGNSVIFGEDWTGSNCGEHDSRGVHSNGCLLVNVHGPGTGRLTAQLRWEAGPGAEMGVFISTGFFAGQGVHGASPLEVSADIRGDTLIVVSLERVAGVRPVPPSASQVFELATQWVAR